MHVAKLHGQNPIALLGTDYFDLSEYVRIAADQGLVIDDPDFLSPQFGDTPLAEGQPLLAVTAGLQEKAYALGLNDATAADVVALQQALTWHVGQNGPLVLEEQQEGGSDSVWFDVTFARFEPDTNVRRAAHGWRMGVLRLWVSPYGTTGTSRLMATYSSPSLVFAQTPAIGGLDGDTAAQLEVLVRTGEELAAPQTAGRNDGRVVALAAVPHPSYRTFFGASDLMGMPGATITNSVTPHWDMNATTMVLAANPLARLDLAPASVYQGRNRILAVCGQDSLPGMTLAGRDGADVLIGPTGVASVFHAQHMVDLGVLTVASSSRAATISLLIETGMLPATGYHGPHRLSEMSLYGLVVLPEESSAIVVDSSARPVAQDGFDPTASGALTGVPDQLGNAWATTSLATAGGLWLFPASIGFAGNYHPSKTGLQTLGNQLTTEPVRDMRIDVAFDLSMASGARVEAVKQISDDTYVRAGVFSRASNANGLTQELEVVRAGSQVAYQSATFVVTALGPMQLTLQTQGPVVRVTSQDVSHASSIQASAAVANLDGVPVVRSTASVNASSPNVRVLGVRVADVPSGPAQASQVYRFDGVAGRVERLTSAGAWEADVSGMVRGRVPNLAAPTCAGVAALAMPMAGINSIRDVLKVEVRVRERFTFLR